MDGEREGEELHVHIRQQFYHLVTLYVSVVHQVTNIEQMGIARVKPLLTQAHHYCLSQETCLPFMSIIPSRIMQGKYIFVTKNR
jgi:hypothetical protein